jgi:hypothetical protein
MRIGVTFVAFPSKDLTPYKLFVLLLNRLQRSCEFEIYDADEDDEFVGMLEEGAVDADRTRARLDGFGQRIRMQIEARIKEFDLLAQQPDQIIVITGATLSDYYYLIRRKKTTLLALGEWEKSMAPPSLVEFMQLQVLRAPYSALEKEVWNVSHLGGRACVFDFCENLENARLMALAGVGVCADCAAALRADGFPEAADEIRYIAGHKWRGERSTAGSPADLMARLGYDLFLTKGFEPTRLERLRRILVDDGVKEGIKVLFAVLLAYLLFRLGLQAA